MESFWGKLKCWNNKYFKDIQNLFLFLLSIKFYFSSQFSNRAYGIMIRVIDYQIRDLIKQQIARLFVSKIVEFSEM